MNINTTQVKVGATHFGTMIGGAIAAVMFMSSHKVDIYAIVDQLNVVVADVTKLLALITPLATGAWGVYKASTKQKIVEVVADPCSPKEAEALPVTPQTKAVAEALKKEP